MRWSLVALRLRSPARTSPLLLSLLHTVTPRAHLSLLGGASVGSRSKPGVPADFLPMARGLTAAVLERARSLVCRKARGREDCLDLQDALGLLRSALECCGPREHGRPAEGPGQVQVELDGEGFGSG